MSVSIHGTEGNPSKHLENRVRGSDAPKDAVLHRDHLVGCFMISGISRARAVRDQTALKPRSFPSLIVVWTHTSVVMPPSNNVVQPVVRNNISKSVA